MQVFKSIYILLVNLLLRCCFVVCLTVSLHPITIGQTLQSYVWPMGVNYGWPGYDAMLFDFRPNTVTTTPVEMEGTLNSHSLLANLDGALELHTNGCTIYGPDHKMIENGDSISFGADWRNCPQFSLLNAQGLLILSWPGDTTKAILIHKRNQTDAEGADLLFSVVQKLEGVWRVIEKNIAFFSSDTRLGLISATRHANGRDWWVITSKSRSDTLLINLVSPEGISDVTLYSSGHSIQHFPLGNAYDGQALFTPDGTMFIRVLPNNGIYLYHFDRCTGLLSFKVKYLLVSTGEAGCAVSSDSRFLYVVTIGNLHQYDLTASDIGATREFIGKYDNGYDLFGTTFVQAVLAPDDKIYITCSDHAHVMHVIHEPRKAGIECDFRQRDFRFQYPILPGVPNVTNYKLGPVDGSTCDSIGVNNIPIAEFRYSYDTIDEQVVHFRNTSSFEPTEFHWTYGDGHASIEYQRPHVYYKSDTYEVCLTASNQYGSDTFCREVPIELSQEYTPVAQQDLLLAPNPTQRIVRITFGQPLERDAELTLTDAQVRVVYQSILSSNVVDHFVDISSLSSGVYFYQISSGNERIFSGKILKSY